MNYDEAKLVTFDKLLPRMGERYVWEASRIIEVSSREPCVEWVGFVYKGTDASGGGFMLLTEWWRRLNLGILVRTP